MPSESAFEGAVGSAAGSQQEDRGCATPFVVPVGSNVTSVRCNGKWVTVVVVSDDHDSNLRLHRQYQIPPGEKDTTNSFRMLYKFVPLTYHSC